MRIAAACAVLVAAFIGALLVGRGGGEEEKVDAPPEVKVIQPPTGDVSAPRLADTGNVPDLHETPAQSSTSGTSSTGTGTSQTSTSTPSTGSTGSTGTTGGGGGGTTQVRPPG